MYVSVYIYLVNFTPFKEMRNHCEQFLCATRTPNGLFGPIQDSRYKTASVCLHIVFVPLLSEPWPAFCYQNIFRNIMVMTDITHKNGAALLHVNHYFDLLRLLLKKAQEGSSCL